MDTDDSEATSFNSDSDSDVDMDTGTRPIFAAIERQNVVAVRDKLQRDINCLKDQDANSDTPLHLATKLNSLDIVRVLCEHGADTASRNGRGKAPLHIAAAKGFCRVAAQLIESHADVSIQNWDRHGITPLHCAIKHQRYNMIRLLFAHGAATDVRTTDDGYTPLHLAVYLGDSKVLNIAPRDVVRRCPACAAGDTLLHLAVKSSTELVWLLLRLGVDPNIQNVQRNTALQLAVMMNLYDIVLLLLCSEKCGPSLRDHNTRGNTVMHEAVLHSDNEILKLLMEAGAPTSEANTVNGDTPLHQACRDNCVAKVRTLLGGRVLIYFKNHKGEIPADCTSKQKIKHMINHYDQRFTLPLYMGLHERLGENSCLSHLTPELLKIIQNMTYQ